MIVVFSSSPLAIYCLSTFVFFFYPSFFLPLIGVPVRLGYVALLSYFMLFVKLVFGLCFVSSPSGV